MWPRCCWRPRITQHILAAAAQRPGKGNAGSLYMISRRTGEGRPHDLSPQWRAAVRNGGPPIVWRIYGILHSIRWPSLAKTGRDGGIDKEQPDAKTRTSRRFHSFRSPVCRSTAVEVCLLWGTCHADMRPMFPHLCVCVVASSLMTTG